MMVVLGIITVVAYISIYMYCRFVIYTERRHPKVFFFDLLKILLASVVAAAMNYTFTAKVSLAAEHVLIRKRPLEGVGWYIAICTLDAVVGAPLAIVFGKLINYGSAALLPKLRADTALYELCRQNAKYGKYGEQHRAESSYITERPPIKWSWWYSQTVTWTLCTVLSGFFCGLLVLYSFTFVKLVSNPIAWIAISISYWNISCLLKQWVVVSLGRIVLSFLTISIIDLFNKFTS